MPKTSFTDAATTVAASWLNKVFNHNHLGQDEDGSAPKINLATEAILDTGGQPIAAPNSPVMWCVFRADGTILASHNVDPVSSALSGSSLSVALANPVRSDVDVSGGAVDHVGAATCTLSTGMSRIFPGARYRKDLGGERVILSFQDSAGALYTPAASDIFTVVAYAKSPNVVG